MRFSDFLEEAPPPAPAPLQQPQPVAPAHQHVLGPPPQPGDVSAFAELFGAAAPDATSLPSPPSVGPLIPHEVPQAAVDIQAAVEALVVQRNIGGDVTPIDALVTVDVEKPIDDDLLPQRGSRVAKSQETRAWSRGRSKR